MAALVVGSGMFLVLLVTFFFVLRSPLVVDRPEMPGIMAGMYQMDSSSLVVVHGSGMCKVGFTGDYAPRIMFPSVAAWPKMLIIMVGMDQKNSYVVLSCHGAEAVSYGPDCSAESYSAVTVHCQVVDVLFVQVLQVPQVQFLEKVVDVPVVCNVRCWPCLCSKLWRSPQLQSIGSWSDVYGGFGRILHIFCMMVNSGPEVVFHSGNLVSTSPLYLAVVRSCVSYDCLWKNFI